MDVEEYIQIDSVYDDGRSISFDRRRKLNASSSVIIEPKQLTMNINKESVLREEQIDVKEIEENMSKP
ncbi:hypothetical protein CWI38_0191p0030 [Hamiltosporidium tvaerminnensis]|uniref:Uncharacterized protein n=1 Tax=Hamiltosporidium tvaerminnensis TaxID=1176355 RepID=A0A4Q9M2P9_9MICR|nr:hypothetical protein CWI38_0191p0030 [Hamiltosporidium tvaerminnensis]